VVSGGAAVGREQVCLGVLASARPAVELGRVDGRGRVTGWPGRPVLIHSLHIYSLGSYCCLGLGAVLRTNQSLPLKNTHSTAITPTIQ